MAKRKLEISEEAFTIRDQPSKAKKHKKVHKAIPVDAESSCDGGSISAPQRSTNALETQTENAVSTRDLQEQYDKLGKKAMEAVHEEDKIQGDIEKTADMAEVGKETSGRKAKKEKRKHTHKERPLGQHGVETKGEQAMKKLQAKPSKSKITEGKGRMKHKHRVKARQKQTRDNKQNNKKENIDKPREKPAWRLSDPSGGYLVDLDPIFSQDEKYLLIAYRATVAVYSTSTSLLVRQLSVKREGCISGLALDSHNADHLYVSTISGLIEKWDWVQGLRLGQWRLSSSIYSLVTSSSGTRDSRTDFVYTIDRKEGEPWLLSAHRLAEVTETKTTDVMTLLKYEDQLSTVQVLEGGKVIMAISGSHIILGYLEGQASPALRDLSYVWRVIDCPEWVASIDARILRSSEGAKKKKETKDVITIAIGGLKGSIYIYDDLLTRMVHKERFPKKADVGDITSRRLHWHRNAVLAIKWSLDGNYVISGGQENTLVLWQLETGQKQFLPHLGASVESIVVSPTGTSYSIRLADNSAMILSTSELKPTFSTAGIQIPSRLKSSQGELPLTPNINRLEGLNSAHVPACTTRGHLLLAVPPSVISRQASLTSQNPSYLQSYDVGANCQISRQALTRTKITTLNMGPESNMIEEPSVSHIQASYDGQWLATVDVWMPPKGDVVPLSFDQERVAEEQVFRQEIYLKFWSWKEGTQRWELVSRIDNPHASSMGNPYDQGRVFELVSHPRNAAFATVGENGIVKTWRPAIRRRNGLEVHGKDGSNLRSWHCKHTIPLEAALLGDLRGAKLAYSQDGSVLVVGIQSSSSSPIYLLDTYSGDIRSVQTGLYSGPLMALGIIDKYLIVVANEICVWDLVADERRYGIQLMSHDLSADKKLSTTHLAVDAENGIFAIAVPDMRDASETNSQTRSQVAIFGPTNPSPLFITPLRSAVTHLLPVSRKKSFYIINPAAEVRTLAPKQAPLQLALSLPKEEEITPPLPSRGLTDVFGNGTQKDISLLGSEFDSVTREPGLRDDVDEVVVSQDQLAKIFDVGPSYALPPVMDLFEQVAKLYCGLGR